MARRLLEGVPATWWGKCAGAGIVGGLLMALYEMVVSQLAGSGFWEPMNLIGATIYRQIPADLPNFVPGLSLAGVVLHLITSAVFGLVYGLLAGAAFPSEARKMYSASLAGMAFGTGVWVVMGLAIGPWIDPKVHMADPLIYATGHLIYGVTTALLVALWARDAELKYLAVTFAPDEMEILTEQRGGRRQG